MFGVSGGGDVGQLSATAKRPFVLGLSDPSDVTGPRLGLGADGKGRTTSSFAWGGFLNVRVLVVLITGLCLFIFYPVLTFIPQPRHR